MKVTAVYRPQVIDWSVVSRVAPAETESGDRHRASPMAAGDVVVFAGAR